MEKEIILDLGSCFTRIYTKENGLVFNQPSLVACNKLGQNYHVKAFGLEAKKLAEIGADDITVFSPFAESKIKNDDYALLLIKHFLSIVGIKKGLFTKLSAVVLISCGTKQHEKEEFSKLLYAAGFDKVKFVFSLVAVSSSIDKNASNVNLIVDIGGSKTDIGVVCGDMIVGGATVNIGGKGMNKSVLDFVTNKYDIALPMVLAEKVKEELASLYDNDVSSMKIRAFDNVSESEIVSIVYAHDVKNAILPYFEEISKLIETTLNMCSDEILNQIKNNGIFICGGVAKITGLEKYLKDKFSLPINIVENCDDCAIIGAGNLIKSGF